jgi:hypothetical protein
MVEKQWFGIIMMVGCLNSDSKIRICPSEFSTDLSTQTRLQFKTYSSWIISLTIQNHPLGVSSELGWLRSNGLALMIVLGQLNSQFLLLNQNLPCCFFHRPQHPNQTDARLTAHGS